MSVHLIGPLLPNPGARPLAVGGQASCGFPSPAADYHRPDLSLDELVGVTPTGSIFMMRAWGSSMVGCGIHDDDVLVVDKARSARIGDIVVAVVGAEFLVKRLATDGDGRPVLLAENSAYPSVTFGDSEELEIWGVVVWVLHNLAGTGQHL